MLRFLDSIVGLLNCSANSTSTDDNTISISSIIENDNNKVQENNWIKVTDDIRFVY